MIAFLTHLWRLLTAVTIYRNIVPELDEIDEAAPGMLPAVTSAGAAPSGAAFSISQELPLPAPPLPERAPDAPPKLPAVPPPSALAVDVTVAPELPPIVIDEKGWMHGERVVHVPTKRKGYRLRGERFKVIDRPSGYIVHWTATIWGTGFSCARRTAPDDGEGNWVHIWIEHDGTIYQSGSLEVGAPHAGAPSAKRIIVEHGEPRIATRKESPYSPNYFFAGAETVCVGEVRRMKKIAGSYVKVDPHSEEGVWISWPFGKKNNKGKPEGHIVPDAQVVDGRDRDGVHRYWQAFTDAQIEAHERIIEALMRTYGLSEAAVSWDHATVDGTRKSDSGLWRTRWLPGVLARIRARMGAAPSAAPGGPAAASDR